MVNIFEEEILKTDKVICDNIDKKEALGIDLLAQNIVAHLRNFVETIARFVCSREQNISNNQKGTQEAIRIKEKCLNFYKR